ncbi:YbdD/YjiX family protein [Acinetobacter albensis]|uniref:YbdD/YjiX family protein n=1 Tax=Acinetobacter albensis TaxID=1673609 RepID=UPI00187E6D7B|nr:YbdD/YjiX family protein [Acinetobacter albensis]MBE9401425.1 YbdD/YjiX family protein [Acinetobacter albensis]
MSLKEQILKKLAMGKIIKFTVLAQPKKFLLLNGIKTIQLIWQRLQQSFRLMVGVPDYETYLQHMARHHADLAPMDEKTFYRYCVDARYPSASGGMKKCPC